MFAWLAELVLVFWLMELISSLKGSAVSSSRFWIVNRFSMPWAVIIAFVVLDALYFLQLLQSGSFSISAVLPVCYLSLGSLLVFLSPVSS